MYGRYLILGICLVLLGDSLDAKQNNDWQNQQRSGTNQYQQNGFLESNSAAKPSEMINIDDNPPQSDVYMGSGDQVVDDDYSGAGIDDEDSEGSAGPNGDDEEEAGSGAGMYKSPCQKLKAKLQTHQVVGAFSPRCTDDGAFEKMQCYGSTGECWCVDEMGRELTGTKTRAPERPECYNLNPVVVDRKPYEAKPEDPKVSQPPPSEPEEEHIGNSVENGDIKEIDNRVDNMPGVIDPSVEIGTAPPETNDVEMLESKGSNMISRSNLVMTQPGILAGIVGGAVVGLLCAVLLVMFIVYRMRKKDEGSYALDEPKRSPSLHTYSRATNREFYA